MARERAPAGEVVSEEVVFEVERFEWTESDRLEVTGRWYGLRGHRFVRPVLTVEADDGSRRMLALLDHKPWAAGDGEPWIAAFPWEGEPVGVAAAELAVAPSLAVDLPAPKAQGRRRKPASTGTARAARRGSRASKPKAKPPAPTKAETADQIAPVRAQLEGEIAALRAERDSEQRTVRRLTAELDDARAQLGAASERSEDVAALRRELDDARTQLAAASRPSDDVAALRRELDAMRAERDDAKARTAVDQNAVREERDAAVRAREAAQQERDEALDQRSAAHFQIRTVLAERDAAIAERDRATAGHRTAVRELEELQGSLEEAQRRPAPAAEPHPAVRAHRAAGARRAAAATTPARRAQRARRVGSAARRGDRPDHLGDHRLQGPARGRLGADAEQVLAQGARNVGVHRL
jgi:hypothetical protein